MDDRRADELVALAAEAASGEATGGATATARLRERADELAAAADHLTVADPRRALQLVASLSRFWQDIGMMDEGRRVTAGVVERVALRVDDLAVVCDARLALSELAFRQGDQEVAVAEARAAIDAAERGEYPAGESLGWSMLARVAFRDRDCAAIQANAARALARAGDDELARRGALHMLAWAAQVSGDIAEARRRFEASLAYRREIGAGAMSEAVELSNIADLDLDAGAIAPAARTLAEVLELAEKADDAYMIVNTVPAAAAAAVAAGRDDEAAQLFGVLDQLVETTGLVPDPGGDRADERRTVAARLGEPAFSDGVQRGRAMTRCDGTALAIDVCRTIGLAITTGDTESG